MKGILRRFFRLFIFITHPILIVAVVTLAILLALKTREADKLNATFQQATAEISEQNQDSSLTIESLKQQFNDLNKDVVRLKAENAQLKQSLERMQVEGSGAISGKLVPVITSSASGISQYQKVCAESTTNPNIQVCRTVAALQQGYALTLPVGSYKVYAEIYPTAEATKDLRAYYSEFAKCLQGSDTSKCDPATQNKPVQIEIKAGVSLGNVDPIDWRI